MNALALLMMLLLIGCTSSPQVGSAVLKPWHQIAPTEQCGEYFSDEPIKNVQLNPEFARQLLSMVTELPLDEPLCWYEYSSGELAVVESRGCNEFDEAVFRRGENWTLVRAQHQWLVLCDMKKP